MTAVRLSELNRCALIEALQGPGLGLRTGGYAVRIKTSIDEVASPLALLYGPYPLVPPGGTADFSCELRPPRGLRRWYRPQVLFCADGRSVFKPLPYKHAFPMLEWGMNWCVARQVFDQLVFHAAAVERGGRALLLAAPPESGKSTLCAALVAHGWRLLTDESTLWNLRRDELSGPARPISLKNASIDVIAECYPDAVLSERNCDTLKGTVAHLQPPLSSIERAGEPAQPRWLIFPRFRPGAKTLLAPRSPGEAFMELAANGFNYGALGRRAFRRTADLIAQVESYDFVYSRLDEAMELFDELAADVVTN